MRGGPGGGEGERNGGWGTGKVGEVLIEMFEMDCGGRYGTLDYKTNELYIFKWANCMVCGAYFN